MVHQTGPLPTFESFIASRVEESNASEAADKSSIQDIRDGYKANKDKGTGRNTRSLDDFVSLRVCKKDGPGDTYKKGENVAATFPEQDAHDGQVVKAITKSGHFVTIAVKDTRAIG